VPPPEWAAGIIHGLLEFLGDGDLGEFKVHFATESEFERVVRLYEDEIPDKIAASGGSRALYREYLEGLTLSLQRLRSACRCVDGSIDSVTVTEDTPGQGGVERASLCLRFVCGRDVLWVRVDTIRPVAMRWVVAGDIGFCDGAAGESSVASCCERE
jgi:hypothetical protein